MGFFDSKKEVETGSPVAGPTINSEALDAEAVRGSDTVSPEVTPEIVPEVTPEYTEVKTGSEVEKPTPGTIVKTFEQNGISYKRVVQANGSTLDIRV